MNEPKSTKEISETFATSKLRDWFGLHRNVVAVSLASFLFQVGEELWQQFRSLYLRALGADERIIGNFGTVKDALDGLYQYPGGWMSDRIGRRRALLMFSGLAVVGYAIYLVAPSWKVMFIGLPFVMAWASLANPSIFATIGDALPKERRAIGFTVQSILRRVPSIIAPPIGGLLIDHFTAQHGIREGVLYGVRLGLGVTIAIALFTLWMQRRLYVELRVEPTRFGGIYRLFRAMHPSLKALLWSDIFIRAAEGMSDAFLVLFARDVVGISGASYGMLISVAKLTSILVYIPVAKKSDQLGRKPFALMTFVFFALFPLTVAVARSWPMLLVAFIVNGLREIGEPPRKAMIVDLAEATARGRTVGLYYLIRSLAIAPAASVGGYLYYTIKPQLPFYVAGAVGFIGVLLFAFTVREDKAPTAP